MRIAWTAPPHRTHRALLPTHLVQTQKVNISIFGRKQVHQRLATLASSRGPPDSVDKEVGILNDDTTIAALSAQAWQPSTLCTTRWYLWWVELHDPVDVGDINAPRRHVCAQQHALFALLELVVGTDTLLLLHAAVQPPHRTLGR